MSVETRGGWPSCWWLSLLILLLVVMPAGAAGEFRTVEIESLKITIDSEWAIAAAPGYLPVRFDVTNLGEARVIEIIGQGTRFSRVGGAQPGGIVVRQALRLARGDRIRLTVPVPIFADNENIWFEFREDGRTLERFNYTGLQGRVPAANASALIVVHNHPSGDPTPSSDDRIVTEQLVQAGRVLDIPVQDHIIIGRGRYLSFAEAGLL